MFTTNSYADCVYRITAATPLAHYATLHSVCSPPDAGYCPPHICSSKHSVNYHEWSLHTVHLRQRLPSQKYLCSCYSTYSV